MKSFDVPRISVVEDYIQTDVHQVPLDANLPKSGNSRSVHEPDDLVGEELGLSADVVPQDVVFPISVEVPDSTDGPTRIDRPDQSVADDGASIHQPHGDISSGVMPEDVGFSISVKVSDSGNCRVGRHAADDAVTEDSRSVHHPDCGSAIGVAPQDVRFP